MVLHPGVTIALRRLGSDELGIARMMAAGELSSPQHYETLTLFALRVTGTGLAYRKGLKEHVWRNPDNYLNSEFLARCNGLAVVWEHPPKAILHGDEFARRVVGTVFLPYIAGSEVWAIVKIYDQQAARLMEDGQLSTSPAVVFRDETVNDRLQSEDGRSLLFEGKPSLLDHLAICEVGVWDKGGNPAGVRNDSEDRTMVKKADGTEEPEDKGAERQGDGNGEKLDKLLDHLGNLSTMMESLGTRMDAMEAKGKADAVKKDGDDRNEDGRDLEDADDLGIPRVRPVARKDANSAAIMADVQARADTAMNLHGKRAPKPLDGETVMAYRLRMLKPLQRFSKEFANARLDLVAKADPDAFGAIEARVYADSEAEANNPTRFEDDRIQTIEKRNPDTGNIYREFRGPRTFVTDISPPVKSYVTKIHTPSNAYTS